MNDFLPEHDYHGTVRSDDHICVICHEVYPDAKDLMIHSSIHGDNFDPIFELRRVDSNENYANLEDSDVERAGITTNSQCLEDLTRYMCRARLESWTSGEDLSLMSPIDKMADSNTPPLKHSPLQNGASPEVTDCSSSCDSRPDSDKTEKEFCVNVAAAKVAYVCDICTRSCTWMSKFAGRIYVDDDEKTCLCYVCREIFIRQPFLHAVCSRNVKTVGEYQDLIFNKRLSLKDGNSAIRI